MMKLYFCLPCIDASDGEELCFISHACYDRRIQCDVFGHLAMDNEWQGWEVWKFSRYSESPRVYSISSRTHDKVLCSDPEGRVFTTENKDGSWEKFRVTQHSHREALIIESVSHGRYLAFSGENLYTTADIDDEDAISWVIEPAHRNVFFISATCHNKRLASSPDAVLTTRNWQEWEQCVIEPVRGEIGVFNVKSRAHNKFLFFQTGWDPFRCRQRRILGKWRLAPQSNSDVVIESVHFRGKNLACNDEGLVYTTHYCQGWETWRLVQVVPGSVTPKVDQSKHFLPLSFWRQW